MRRSLRNAAIWFAVVTALAGLFVYQYELRDFAGRVQSELRPHHAVSTKPGTLVLTEGPGGHFFVQARINNQPVVFLIDTGATEIVLSPSDAQRAGINLADLVFDRVSQTANGPGLGARHMVDTLSIGPLDFQNVPIAVNRAEMGTSLLGMSFLRRMAAVEIRGRQLFLHWKH